MRDDYLELGKFEVTTNKLVISDPCYNLETWCQGVLENVKNGNWSASVKKEGNSCAELVAVFECNLTPDKINSICTFEVGVDSGQAGIFDSSVYQNHDSVVKETNFDPSDKWYSSCCDATLGDVGAGIIPGGVVSSSGHGDGGYNCYTHLNHEGFIDGVKIVFIGDRDDDDDYDYDEDEDEDDEEDEDEE